MDDYYGDYDDGCPVCGAYEELVTCWQCQGQGGFHDCGEDTCCCLDKEEITDECEECDGEGGYWQCVALPHIEEQLTAHRQRQSQVQSKP